MRALQRLPNRLSAAGRSRQRKQNSNGPLAGHMQSNTVEQTFRKGDNLRHRGRFYLACETSPGYNREGAA